MTQYGNRNTTAIQVRTINYGKILVLHQPLLNCYLLRKLTKPLLVQMSGKDALFHSALLSLDHLFKKLIEHLQALNNKLQINNFNAK